MSISDKIQEAREWSRCIDTLKASVDSMYEICRIQQNILGCEEAIMFLKMSVQDFVSLIDTIKIEQNWENSEKRPMTSVTWEIRGTVSKSNFEKAPAKEVKEKQCQTPTKKAAEKETKQKEKKEENEWQLVERKKSSNQSKVEKCRNDADLIIFPPFNKLNKAPKSAMDLPQTKSSMAKMAYSRQLMFEKHKETLLEKFNNRRRKEKQQNDRADGQSRINKRMMTEKTKPDEPRRNVLAEEERKSLEKDERMADGLNLKKLIDQLSDDCEWRAMTEEEESLKQEEQSLRAEIEFEEEEEQEDEQEENLVPSEEEDFVNGEGGLNEINECKEEIRNKKEGKGMGQEHGGGQECHYRNPGELAQLRAKLLSPTKRRRTDEIDHFSESKLRRAEELRISLQQVKAQRLHLLHQRVEEVRKKREEIQTKKMAHLEMVKGRIQKAEENRQKSLEEIVQRAQEDEMKIMEINLLNSFEAANQRLEKRFTQIRERNRYEKMVQKTEEDRQRRIEENQKQREEAEKRRKDAEEQRMQRLKDQANQREERQSHAQKHRTKTIEGYRAKVVEHSQKVSQRKERELADKQKLLDKIQNKHNKRSENYEQCKEQVRRRAIELSSPRPCHYWAQSLADFSQLPSDLSLQQRPVNLERSEEKAGQSCFRCGTALHNDLQLISHVLSSEEHLSRMGMKLGAILQNGEINYDFMKNELDKMALPSNSADEEEYAEVMTKSADESALGNVPMERIIASNAQMLISDQILLKLLLIDEDEDNKKKTSNGTKKKRMKMRQKFVREFEAMPTSNNQSIDPPKNDRQKDAQNKMVEALQWRINKCAHSMESSGGSSDDDDHLIAVERGLIELLKALQQNNGRHERALLKWTIQQTELMEKLLALNLKIWHQRPGSGHGARTLIKSLSLLNMLLDTSVDREDNHRHFLGGKALLHLCDLFQLNVAKLIAISSNTSIDDKLISDQLRHSTALSIALFLLQLFGRFSMANSDHLPAHHQQQLLFSYLCSCCSLLQFISLCGRHLELGNFLLGFSSSTTELELFKPSDQQRNHHSSPCEVITSFVIAFLGTHTNGKKDELGAEEQSNAKIEEAKIVANAKLISRNSSVDNESLGSCGSSLPTQFQQQNSDRIKLCALLWMYCLAIHGYHHFRQLGLANSGSPADSSSSTLLPSSSAPASPTKSNHNTHNAAMSVTLSKCILRQFNAIATNCQATVAWQQRQLLQFFLDIETDHTMATRMACLFRSILQQTVKVANQREVKRRTGNDHQQHGNEETMADLLGEFLEAVGHFAACNIRTQLLCVIGWHRSMVSLLCSSLPLTFVHSAPTKHFLLPTLIIILRHSPVGIEQIRTKFCLHFLIDYLKAAIRTKSLENSQSNEFEFLALLEPSVNEWVVAKEFFESAASVSNAITGD